VKNQRYQSGMKSSVKKRSEANNESAKSDNGVGI